MGEKRRFLLAVFTAAGCGLCLYPPVRAATPGRPDHQLVWERQDPVDWPTLAAYLGALASGAACYGVLTGGRSGSG